MIPLVETGGAPFAIGHDVGRACRDQLRAAAASARAELSGLDPGAVEIGPWLAPTVDHAPWVFDELRGMAEGSGVPLPTLFALNAGAELAQAAGIFECTVAAVGPTGSVDGHTLLAHNEDTTAGWGDLAYVVKAEPDDAPAFAAFTYAGLLLHQGVNAAGLGSVGNALYARDARPGVPKLFQYRRALACRSLEAAVRTVTGGERAFGNNHLLATADGLIVDVEVSGTDWDIIWAGNRPLAHANHFAHPRLTHLDADEDLLNSRLRHARTEQLLDAAWGTLDPAALRRLMADHANWPGSVCKHHAPESDLTYGTIGSVVIDVTARELWACAGNPCRGEWRHVAL